MEIFEDKLAKLLRKYSSGMDNLGRHFDTLVPPNSQNKGKTSHPELVKTRQAEADLASYIREGNVENYGDFVLTHFKRIKAYYPLLHAAERGRLEPVFRELEADFLEWERYRMERINEISKTLLERNPGKKEFMFQRLMTKLRAPYFFTQHTAAVVCCESLLASPLDDFDHPRWRYHSTTDSETGPALHELTLKQKFGLTLLLTKADIYQAKVTSSFRTIERQGELMVQNDLMVNHPSYPQGTGTDEGVEKKEKSLPNYYRGVFKEYAKELGELIIEGRLCNTYGFPAEAEARNLNKQQIIALAEHTMQLLLKTDRFTGMVARALVKVQARVKAYSDWETSLTDPTTGPLTKPPFPASHFSGNVVDLKFPGVEIETTINAFTSILEWGTTMGIVRSSRYEVSHFHIVLER